MVILVTYDLQKPGRNYDVLYEALRKAGTSWARPVESVWLLDTGKAAEVIHDELRPHVDANDRLFVVELKPHWWGSNLPTEVMEWLRTRAGF